MIVTCPKCKRPFVVSQGCWTRNDANVARTLDFERMILVTQVSGMLDGEAQYSLGKDLDDAWSEECENKGWTKQEWTTLGRQEFEVRRIPDGRWESRRTYRQWYKDCTMAVRALENPGAWLNFSAKKDFEELLGYSWEHWLNREREPLPEVQQRPWKPIDDEFWPSIETAYQRYIHHG